MIFICTQIPLRTTLGMVLLLLPLSVQIVWAATAPGGVSSGLTQWYRADEGADNSTWQDQSIAAEDGTIYGPTLQSGATSSDFNFHPYYSFSGTTPYIDIADISEDWSAGISLYVVARSSSTNNWARFLDFGNGMEADVILFSRIGTTSNFRFETYDPEYNLDSSGNEIVNNQTALYQSNLLKDASITLSVNGNTIAAGTGEFPGTVTRTRNYIGRSNWSIDDYFHGGMAEIIIFNSGNSTNSERERIESYLGAKYGITLSHPYIASDNATVFWTTGSGYDHDIICVGRDDGSGLVQIRSTSIDSDAVFTVLAVDEGVNSAPAFSDMADLEFMAFGNNNGPAAWTTSGAPAGSYLLNRQWRIQEIGDVGDVSLSVAVDNAGFDIPSLLLGTVYYFIIDTDHDGLLSDETPFAMSSITASQWTLPNINPENGQLFTLADFLPPTHTPTASPTQTDTPTLTSTITKTVTPVYTATATASITCTPTPTPSITTTPTITLTRTPIPPAHDLSHVIVYPNPYRTDNNFRPYVTLANLPAQAKLSLYSLDGRLVKVISKDDSTHFVRWDLTNQGGKNVASGVYIYRIESSGEIRTGKIAILQ